MTNTLYIDNTMISCFNQCPQKFKWRHVEHLTSKGSESSALTFGAAMHKALETLYKGESLETAILSFQKEMPEQEGEGARSIVNGVKLIEAYHKKWFPENFKVIKVEVSANIELTKDIIFCGRLDTIIERDGEVYILEHKTTSNFKWFIPTPNHQVSGYLYILNEMGYKPEGCIVNLMLVSKTKNDFHRIITQRDTEQLNDWRKIILTTKLNIDKCESTNWWPRYTHSCWNCGYVDLCNSDENALEYVKESLYLKKQWKPWEVSE